MIINCTRVFFRASAVARRLQHNSVTSFATTTGKRLKSSRCMMTDHPSTKRTAAGRLLQSPRKTKADGGRSTDSASRSPSSSITTVRAGAGAMLEKAHSGGYRIPSATGETANGGRVYLSVESAVTASEAALLAARIERLVCERRLLAVVRERKVAMRRLQQRIDRIKAAIHKLKQQRLAAKSLKPRR